MKFDISHGHLSLLFRLPLVLALMVAIGSCTQAQTDSRQSTTLSTAEGYRYDLQELADRIRAEHPRPFRFISEADFDQLVSENLSQIDAGTTYWEFLWAFSEVIASIQCGHSSMFYFNQENSLIEAGQRFPVEVRLVGERLIVLDPLVNADRLAIEDEIARINGRPVDQIIDEIFEHISAEGVSLSYRDFAFNSYATAYLTYALGFPEAYEITLSNERGPIRLEPLADHSFRPIIHPEDPCQDRLCLRTDAETNTAIMTIRDFNYYGADGQVFADFINTSLNDIVMQDRSALVIDIRGHGGGSGYAGAYILRRLAEEPFDYWSEETDPRGPEGLFEVQQPVDVGLDIPVYLVVDGRTSSSAPHFAAIFREHGMGTIIGEPMGGNFSTNDGAGSFASTHNGVEYRIARMRFDVAAPSQSIDHPTQPHVVLNYTLEDIIHGEDTMMDFVLDHIATAQNQ